MMVLLENQSHEQVRAAEPLYQEYSDNWKTIGRQLVKIKDKVPRVHVEENVKIIQTILRDGI
jgi:hypothetical protein